MTWGVEDCCNMIGWPPAVVCTGSTWTCWRPLFSLLLEFTTWNGEDERFMNFFSKSDNSNFIIVVCSRPKDQTRNEVLQFAKGFNQIAIFELNPKMVQINFDRDLFKFCIIVPEFAVQQAKIERLFAALSLFG